MNNSNNNNRDETVILKDFYGPGRDIRQSDLGWQMEQKREAQSLVSKVIFNYEIVRIGLNMAFYYIDNDTFYGIHRERYPIEVKILPRDRSEQYLGFQCECDTHDDGEVIYSFDRAEDLWDGIRIDGKTLENVLEHSYITSLS